MFNKDSKMTEDRYSFYPRDPREGQVFRLYHYMPSEWIDDVLMHTHLKLSAAMGFNDIFDGAGVCRGEFSERTLSAHVAKVCIEMHIPKNVSLIVGREMAADANVRKCCSEYFSSRIGVKDLLSLSRLLCFSKPDTDEADILMWSYYADKWRGLRLGFDMLYENHATLDYKGTTPYFLEYVRYRNERPELDLSDVVNIDEPSEFYGVFKDVLLTKSLAWQHENEWRLLASENFVDTRDGLKFWQFDRRILRTVDLGPFMPTADKKHVAEIVCRHFPRAAVNVAMPDTNYYRVNYEPYKRADLKRFHK